MARFRAQKPLAEQQALAAGAPMPEALRIMGAALMGGLGGILLNLLAVRGSRSAKAGSRP